MAQQLRALNALPEDLSSVPRNYMVVHNPLQWDLMPLTQEAEVGLVIATEAFFVSPSQLCICSHLYHSKSSLVLNSLQEHGSLASTQFVEYQSLIGLLAVAVSTHEKRKTLRGSPDHRHQLDLRWKQDTQITMAHKCQHGFGDMGCPDHGSTVS